MVKINAENINLYTGVNATPKKTAEQTGTVVTFSGIHGLVKSQMEEKLNEFLLKEFAWFLALNSNRDFSISVNGIPIDFNDLVADQEELSFMHEDSQTTFTVRYVRWNQRLNNEPSRYYYINSEHKERWKEPTVIKNKGEQFYHSIFVKSLYFDAFSFQAAAEEKQEALIVGTRSDSQFRFLRKKLATILRIKRRPFLKVFAEKLISEYEEKNILPAVCHESLRKTLTTIYEMQPRIFTSLNLEQKKIMVGLLQILLESNNKNALPALLSSAIDLTPDEQSELEKLFY
ncbi:MAG: hypothetical protein UT03_C0060G0003 [Candidatus Moranbacteria bacterium GW2011_GWD2_38_7]|nr:MAG: hypothetical protein UT03_C0060G0003 [Candidatus Moranbacteria bacterium GW2011_GWD2_38_7]